MQGTHLFHRSTIRAAGERPWPLPARGRSDHSTGRLGALRACAVCALLLTAAIPAQAVVLGGSLRSSAYVWKSRGFGAERIARTDSLTSHTQLIETLRLDALQLGLSGMSFHTSFTAANVLTDQSFKETRVRLYRGYLQEVGRAHDLRYDLRLGRQWVTAGVGTGVVDGIAVGLSLPQWGGLDGFFGTLGSDRLTDTDRFWTLDKPGDSRSYGGRLRLQRVLGPVEPSVAVSYGQAKRKPHDTLVTDAERMGVHGDLQFSPDSGSSFARFLQDLRAWGDWRRDMVFGRTLEAAGGLEYSGGPRGLNCWADYSHRRPALRTTSFFASFDARAVTDLRGGVGMDLYRRLHFSVDADMISFFEKEHEAGVELLLSGYGATVGYRFHGGYGGDLSGLVLYGHRDIGEKLTLDASINFTQYKYPTTSDPGVTGLDDHETAGILAAGYRLLPNLTFTGQAEGMQNHFFKHDVRFLGTLNWRFRTAL